MIAPATTLVDLVRRRAAEAGDRVGYEFLVDGANEKRTLTWSQLDRRASTLAADLRSRGAAGQPVLLALPSGLAFVESLFACWYAGAIAVPVSLPRHHRAKHRLDGIVANAGARFAIGTADVQARLIADGPTDAALATLVWLDATIERPAADVEARPDASLPAVLQYTSGSTGTPRGVVVTHANVTANAAMSAVACGHDESTVMGGWLPLFHDMGLIGMVVAMAYAGGRLVFTSPERFLMRPISWLRMISDHRMVTSPAPNFAYDLCVDRVTDEQKASLDLSCWRTALNGSEPVRPATMARFADAFASCGFDRRAFFPCYGLAEATLMVTAPSARRRAARCHADGAALPDGASHGHVGNGAAQGDAMIEIVDPATCRRVASGAVGEIWVCGASVAAGYWNDAAATAQTFHARLADDDGSGPWLRTGDLGRFVDGELFVTGRLRELIIVAGRNFFPVDLERTAEVADACVAPSAVAAFSADVGDAERLIVVAELRREIGRAGGAPPDVAAIARRLRAAIAAEHEVTPHDVVIVRPGELPRTTSGKLSRLSARDAYLANTLELWEPRADARIAS